MKAKEKEKNNNRNVEHPLETLYEKALVLGFNEYIPIEKLREKLGISKNKASCVFYMLSEKVYCPELEEYYAKDEDEDPREKNEKYCRMVKFLEDIPPFQKNVCYVDEISETDKKRYVSLGFAKWSSFEENRQRRIQTYISFSRILTHIHTNIHEAFERTDVGFFKFFFHKSDKKQIIETLEKEGLTEAKIKKVFNMMAKRGSSQVILINCHCHFFEEVVFQIQKTLGCLEITAERHVETANTYGSAVVFEGSRKECERISKILERTGLEIKIT